MSGMFRTPEGALRSNLGLMAGTVIQELRMYPCIDRELEEGHWNYRPEYVEFTVVFVSRDYYRCRYSREPGLFYWPAWKEQPHYGYWSDGCTPVRYYVKEEPLPPPYPESRPDFSPYGLRCAEIDEAALLLRDPDAFAEAAAEPDTPAWSSSGNHHKNPSERFFDQGGCPFFRGKRFSRERSAVLCKAVSPQLHGYVGVKFCEEGRKTYCPIWRAKSGR